MKWRELVNIAITALILITVAFLRPMLTFITGSEAPLAAIDGKSMLPTLREGDLVFSYKPKPSEINVGDVVIYRRGSTLIIHRVIAVLNEGNSTCYLVKGDNNPTVDPALPPCKNGIPYLNIEGKVIEVSGYVLKLPYLGYYSLWLNNLVK
ncbi:MAG: signal peptidase I [Sulfolobales archaeon]|nr:signal peptidase I [Sulfolobales archaeon]MCX8198783.1 signal peptidase I [Sulfolobales archaeon]MDW8169856.1 signal peptidase I [Desulfurococcaceae archaeon]